MVELKSLYKVNIKFNPSIIQILPAKEAQYTLKNGNKIHDTIDDYVHIPSFYDDVEADKKKLSSWFYNSYYGPEHIFPVLKTRKQYCLCMLGLTLAIIFTLMLLRESWNPIDLLNDVPFFSRTEYYEKVGEGGDYANYWGYLILTEGAVALSLSILQLFIIDKSVGKKRLLSREGICFWLLCTYLAALFGRILIPLMKWHISNRMTMAEFTLLSPDIIYAALVGGAFFYAMSSGITAIISVYLSILLFLGYWKLGWAYIIIYPFDWINRVTGRNIFTNVDIILGVSLTMLTQIFINFLEWLPFWDDFILWLKRKLTMPVVLLVIGLGSLAVAFIAEYLGTRQ